MADWPVKYIIAFFCIASLGSGQACETIPASATEVETAILSNQCKILKELRTITKGEVSESLPIGSNGYVAFTLGTGTTGGNPCSGRGMHTQSCGRYFEELMERTCRDGRCDPIFSPRITDFMSEWKNYLQDPTPPLWIDQNSRNTCGRHLER